jgi:hypothetical protein
MPNGPRRIYRNVPFTADETQKLKAFMAHLVSRDIKLPEWWTDALSIKILYTANFDIKQATK